MEYPGDRAQDGLIFQMVDGKVRMNKKTQGVFVCLDLLMGLVFLLPTAEGHPERLGPPDAN